jgi:aspartyl-tRNA(Asn)/glutamyl-tRNA(Gln) amidotransferase subunit A
MDIKNLSIRKASEAMKKGDLTPKDLALSYKKVAEEKNSTIHAFLEVFSDLEEQAEIAEKKIKDGTATLLTGIPVATKDNILIKGHGASAGSHILEHFVSPYDSTAAFKLKEHGAIFLGRTNMDEFAMGSSTENSAFGVTRNPHDTTRVPGGSSGGSAAAVAMDGTLVALGSDTGGSVSKFLRLCGT